jgi:hypothetical protein
VGLFLVLIFGIASWVITGGDIKKILSTTYALAGLRFTLRQSGKYSVFYKTFDFFCIEVFGCAVLLTM